MRRFLVQPEPGGRISGGYLYNQRMAAHAPADRPLALLSVPAAAGEALRALDLAAGDLVVADSLFLHADRLAPFAALRARGVRLGVVLHALPSFIERAAAGLGCGEPSAEELNLLGGLDFAILPGPFLRDLLAPSLTTRLHVCPPGLDDTWLRAATPARSTRAFTAILSVGAVTPNKGFGDLVDALASLSTTSPVRLSIAGSTEVDAAHVARLRERIAGAGLSGAVHLLGQVGVADLGALFADADIFALASHTENHPLAAMEAVASCVPTVAYDVGGVSTIIDSGETGLLAPVRDVEALAAHLGRLIADHDLRRAMALACSRARQSLLSWSQAAEALAASLDREQARIAP